MKKLLLLTFSLIGLLLISGGYFYQKEYSKTVNLEVKPQNRIKRAKRSEEYTNYYKSITHSLDNKSADYTNSYRFDELQKALRIKSNAKKNYTFESRGPANIGGRTRALVIDPDDATNSTWFVGAATGGVWKTTDKGNSWVNLTNQLPNLSTCALVMAQSDHNVLYAGTGESFPGGTYLYGSGIFRSDDKGLNWTLLSSTANNSNFNYVNRIIVDETNANIVLAATNSGVFKSTDGGVSWSQKYSTKVNVEQIISEPGNFNIQYATVNAIGIIKSTDAGETWNMSTVGLIPSGRMELAISPVNKNNVFASVDGSVPTVYLSKDKAQNWILFKQGTSTVDFLTQGGYDNAVAAHPSKQYACYVAGVNINLIDFNGSATTTQGVVSAYVENTESFLSFINFGGEYFGGGMTTTDVATNLAPSDWCDIEIRFGAGKTQKAHRFTVGGLSSGVPASGYVYKDYVDVPFEVWDLTHNRQLMVSFRDQSEDGQFTLEARNDAVETSSREYLFVNAVTYSKFPDANIAKTGGRAYKQLYFFWPTLAAGGSWNPDILPESKIIVTYGSQNAMTGQITKVADAYGNVNSYDQGAGYGKTKIPGLHPDHHSLTIIPGASIFDNFTMLNTNDGGIAISTNSGNSFEMKISGYNTTQFYGVSKKHGADEYFGGMQDNGSWQSPANTNINSLYTFRIGGDGFHTLWHYTNPKKMIGSVYYNDFKVTTTSGLFWSSATSGITYDSENDQFDGPFVTKLASSKSKADMIFAIGSEGIWKNTNFGSATWLKKLIPTGWAKYGAESYHSVEVSLANDNIVWAGAGMAADYGYKLFVSTDEGNNFTAAAEFDKVDMHSRISGLATHPTLDSTAFALFSVKGKPKVLRTDDLGLTWRDLSGFADISAKGTVSTNGFPDVVVNDLLVMPYDTSIIWVGTDIGIFESTNSGSDWHILEANMPFVSIHQMQIIDNQVVLATHGRGIWTVSIPEIRKVPVVTGLTSIGSDMLSLDVELFDACDKLEIYLNGELNTTVTDYTADAINAFEISINKSGSQNVYVKAYFGENVFESNSTTKTLYLLGISSLNIQTNRLEIYPNPSKGQVNFKMKTSEIDKNYNLKVFTLNGKEVFAGKGRIRSTNQLMLENLSNGQYLMMLSVDDVFYVEKLLISK